MSPLALARRYRQTHPRAWARHLTRARAIVGDDPPRVCCTAADDRATDRAVARIIAAVSLRRELDARRAAKIAAADAAHLDVHGDEQWRALRRVERELNRERIREMDRQLGVDSFGDGAPRIVRDRAGNTLTIHPPR